MFLEQQNSFMGLRRLHDPRKLPLLGSYNLPCMYSYYACTKACFTLSSPKCS